MRNPIHITDCALWGADIATVPYKVIEQMVHHPLTDAGIDKFKKDYEAVFGKIIMITTSKITTTDVKRYNKTEYSSLYILQEKFHVRR